MGLEKECSVEELTIETSDGPSTAFVLSPGQADLAENPLLLLTLAMDRETSLYVEPYNLAARSFLQQGHRVVSLDLPHHGKRVSSYGEGITGFRNAFVEGRDDFAGFVNECKAVIDGCIEKGLGAPGRIAVAGTSRAGYLAMRLLGADDRVFAGAAFAPVTDWRKLSEFAEDTEREDVAALRITEFVEPLAGKAVYCVIGNHDERVSTTSCVQFYLDLLKANARRGFDDTRINFQVQDEPGHSSRDEWYYDAAEFLVGMGEKI